MEEVLYDTELSFFSGKEVRPKHLQTADMRMPICKARIWDLMAVTLLGTGLFSYSAWLVWIHQGLIHRWWLA
jgi:hypothetical protein